MTTVTIPKQFQGEKNLIAFPERVYEEFLVAQRVLKEQRTFEATPVERRLIMRGRREFRKGKFTDN